MSSGKQARRRRARLEALAGDAATARLVAWGHDRYRRRALVVSRSTDPAASLMAVVEGRQELDQLEAECAWGMLATGHTWADVGQVLGITARGAHLRLAARVDAYEQAAELAGALPRVVD